MIHVIYYDRNKVSPEDVKKFHNHTRIAFPNDEIVTMPLGLTWVRDYPITELNALRDYLTEIIEKAEEKQNDL